MKRTLKNGEPSIKLTSTYTKQRAIEESYTKKVEEGYRDWYPNFWFAFIAMGRPVGDGNCSALFNSGLPTKVMTNGLGPTASIMYGEAGRDARRQEHRKMMESLATSESVSSTSISRKRKKDGSIGSISSSNSTPNKEGTKKMQMIIEQKYLIQTYKDQIQVMTELGCDEEEITTVKKNYLALLTGITSQNNPTLKKVATSTATTMPTTSSTNITSLVIVEDDSDYAEV